MKKLFFHFFILLSLLLPGLIFGKTVHLTDYDVKEKLSNEGLFIEQVWDDARFYTLLPVDENAITDCADIGGDLDSCLTQDSKKRFNDFLKNVYNQIEASPVNANLKKAIMPYFEEISFKQRIFKKDEYMLDCPSLPLRYEIADDSTNEKGVGIDVGVAVSVSYENESQSSDEFSKTEGERFSEERYRLENPTLPYKLSTHFPSMKDILSFANHYKMPLAAPAIGVADLLLGAWLEFNMRGETIINYFPTTYWLSSVAFAYPAAVVNGLSSSVLGENIASTVSGPVIEELLFRYFLQKVILHELPRELLGKIAPKYAHLTDCQLAKIARVFISSTMFGLGHLSPESLMSGYYSIPSGVSQLWGGIVYGAIVEYMSDINMGLATSTIVHSTHNACCVILSR